MPSSPRYALMRIFTPETGAQVLVFQTSLVSCQVTSCQNDSSNLPSSVTPGMVTSCEGFS